MNVKELKELLRNIPDSYELRTRAENAHLDNDECFWQLNFSGGITKVKVIKAFGMVMLIRGIE